MEKVLITGTAGFIGFHLTNLLLHNGYEVYGIDSINTYYEVTLKYDRLKQLGFNTDQIKPMTWVTSTNSHSHFIQANLEDKSSIEDIFSHVKPDYVINLAAQAGVRYSLENPHAYIDANITGFLNILEGCRHNPVKHLIYASSSSVYGLNQSFPFSVDNNVDHPVSLYAATKKSNELMAHTYSYLYNIPTTGLRFFTVYGPWGRPDMALFIFTKSILEGKPMQVFNNGAMQRDFTYVDDIIESIKRLIPLAPVGNPSFDRINPDPSHSLAPYTIYNIGNNSPVALMDFIQAIEDATGKKSIIEYKPMQPGDVEKTYADVTSLFEVTDYKPKKPVREGIQAFVDWYRGYYGV